MKRLLIAIAAVTLLAIGGCATKVCCCSSTEIDKLKEKKHLVICKCGEIKNSPNCCKKGIPKGKSGFNKGSIRDRIIMSAQNLTMTPEELKAFKKKYNIIICGQCGHVLGSEKCCKKGAEIDKRTGFAKDSIRNRILGPYID